MTAITRIIPISLSLSLLPGLLSAEMFPDSFTLNTAATDAFAMTSLEGPAWNEYTQTLYFSNQNSPFALHSYNNGVRELFKNYTNKVNGNAIDLYGNLITCESGNRRVVRIDEEGNVTPLVTSYNGAQLNEPNDVVVKSDGTIWFTTPSWNNGAEKQRQYVLRHDPATGETVHVVDDIDLPNGLCFSPDEKILYLNDNALNRVIAYDVEEDNSLSNDRILISNLNKWPDGITVDAYGNLYVALFDGPDRGVVIYSPEGELLHKIPSTKNTTNVEFGGPTRRTLYITSGNTLYSVAFPPLDFEAPGAPKAVKSLLVEDGVQLQWNDADETELGFIIERAREGESSELIAKIHQADTRSYVDETAVVGEIYTYSVIAYNAAGKTTSLIKPLIQSGNDLYYGEDLGDGYRSTSWLGDVLTAGPWAWTAEHGWWYFAPLGRSSQFVYDMHPMLGWLWTGESLYPFVYSFEEETWLWFYTVDAENARWFLRVGDEVNPWLVVPGEESL